MTTDARIESLEHQVRTLKRMLFGVFGVVVVGGLLAATTLQKVPDVVQAKKFEVVDATGKPVAVLSSDTRGGTLELTGGGLAVFDDKGTLALQATANSRERAGSLVLFNKEGKQIVSLGPWNNNIDGGGTVMTKNAKGELTSMIGGPWPSGSD